MPAQRLLVRIVHPRLAHITVLVLFSTGLALHSCHLGHDIFADEHAECECVAIDRQDGAVHLLAAAAVATRAEVAASVAVAGGFARSPDVYYGARAPPGD